MSLILSLDLKITAFLANLFPHNQFFTYFFSFFSLKGNSIFIWILIVVALVIFEEKKDKKFIIYFAITFLTTAFLVNIVFKNIFMRPRPFYSPAVRRSLERRANSEELSSKGSLGGQLISTACPKSYSFPSGHASTAFAAAYTLSFFDKKRRYFYYTLASLISYSRIFLYCHYFIDVLIGALIGYLISKLTLRLLKIKGHLSLIL